MKKYIFFLMGAVCFLLSSSAVHANELNKSDANIIGHVLDKNTEEHLSFISVSLKGTTIGTMTDASGHYFLKNLPEGEFTMEVSAVGYKTVSRKVTLRKGKTLEENFEIEEDLIALDGVVVSANRSETTRRMAPTLVNVMDVKVFVDADPDDRLIRVIARDCVERGRTPMMVINRYQDVLKPMHQLYIEPSKRTADLIVPQGGTNIVAINLLTDYIKSQLKGGCNRYGE